MQLISQGNKIAHSLSIKFKIIEIKFKYLIIINQYSLSNLKILVIKMHHLSLFFRLLIESEEDLNVALSLCECVDESLYRDQWIQEIWEDAQLVCK